VLVTDKKLRAYAELVERRLLELNLCTDLCFMIDETLVRSSFRNFRKLGSSRERSRRSRTAASSTW